MGEDSEERAEVYVQPGESHLVQGPAVMHTLLGSCVGVTFWNRRRRIGALCHPMLPKHPGTTKGPLSLATALRYVDFAIRNLAARLDSLGVPRREIEVKLFGGADVLTSGVENPRHPTVGRMNADAAVEVLFAEGFAVVASRLGGRQGCHIDFDTTTGEVRLRELGRVGQL